MRLGSLRALAICGALLLLGFTPASAGARSAGGRHCAYLLEPVARPKPHVVSARLVKVGCYGSLSESIQAGTGGAVRLPARTSASDLTEELIAASSVSRIGNVVIGTEWNGDNFSGSSKDFMAPDTCAGTTYEVAYVGDTWNDKFESGKGFGGCDTNRKFVHSDFGGDVLTCTPNCGDYGALRNEVSSLKWKP
jgi:hypothetical protein